MGDSAVSTLHCTAMRVSFRWWAVVPLLCALEARRLPPMWSGAANFNCESYQGTVCADVVDYEYFVASGRTAEKADASVKDSVAKYQGKIYECRAAAKRYFCAVNFSKCRRMESNFALPGDDLTPTVPTLPCKRLCQEFEKACRVKEETCGFLSDEHCNDLTNDQAQASSEL